MKAIAFTIERCEETDAFVASNLLLQVCSKMLQLAIGFALVTLGAKVDAAVLSKPGTVLPGQEYIDFGTSIGLDIAVTLRVALPDGRIAYTSAWRLPGGVEVMTARHNLFFQGQPMVSRQRIDNLCRIVERQKL